MHNVIYPKENQINPVTLAWVEHVISLFQELFVVISVVFRRLAKFWQVQFTLLCVETLDLWPTLSGRSLTLSPFTSECYSLRLRQIVVFNGHQTPFSEKGTTQPTPTSLFALLTNHQHFYLPLSPAKTNTTFNTDIMKKNSVGSREKSVHDNRPVRKEAMRLMAIGQDCLKAQTCCHLGKGHLRKKGKYYKGINKCKEFVEEGKKVVAAPVKWPWKAPFEALGVKKKAGGKGIGL